MPLPEMATLLMLGGPGTRPTTTARELLAPLAPAPVTVRTATL